MMNVSRCRQCFPGAGCKQAAGRGRHEPGACTCPMVRYARCRAGFNRAVPACADPEVPCHPPRQCSKTGRAGVNRGRWKDRAPGTLSSMHPALHASRTVSHLEVRGGYGIGFGLSHGYSVEEKNEEDADSYKKLVFLRPFKRCHERYLRWAFTGALHRL